MLWLAHHNPEIDWRIGEIKMIRCLKECEKQWMPKQGKPKQQKQKKKEKKQEEKEQKKEEKKKKQKKDRIIKVKRVTEEWEIWDKKVEAAKSERGQEISSSKILQVDSYLKKESK